MGNQTTSTTDIQYLRTIEDPQFGQIELYRQQDIELIMKKTFTFVSTDAQTEVLKHQLHFMHETKHASLAPVHHLNFVREKHLCIEYEKVSVYVEYYNYTFANILEKGGMELNELWYALNALSDIGAFLFKNSIYSDQFSPERIFLSLKGVPCIYLFDPPLLYSFDTEKPHPVRTLALTILSLAFSTRIEDNRQIYLPYLDTLQQSRCPKLSALLSNMLDNDYSFQQVLDTIDDLLNGGQIKLANSLKITKFKALIPTANPANHNSTHSSTNNPPSIGSQHQMVKHNRVVAKQESTTSLNTTSDRVERIVASFGGSIQRQHSSSSSKSSIKADRKAPPPFVVAPDEPVTLNMAWTQSNHITSRNTSEALKQLQQKKFASEEQRRRMRQRMESLLGKQNKVPGAANNSANTSNHNSSATLHPKKGIEQEMATRTGTSQKKDSKQSSTPSSLQRPPKHINNISWSRRVAGGGKRVYI